MNCPPAEGNFCDEHENAVKPATVQDYNRQMHNKDKCENMTTITPLSDTH
jgi:hypothetical protein